MLFVEQQKARTDSDAPATESRSAQSAFAEPSEVA
jgi:hypothetical protein